MSDFAPELIKILLAHECFVIRRGKGDHTMWRSIINGKAFPVDHKIKSRHMANVVLKQAGIPKKF